MATKTAECMALRRAFDVSAPVVEERWDLDVPEAAPEHARPVALADKVATRRAAIEARRAEAPAPTEAPPDTAEATAEGDGGDSAPPPSPDPAQARCDSTSPYEPPTRCGREAGHAGLHRNRERESWQ